MNITKTTNPIHFEDLEPMRFEDLAFNLLYRQSKWHSINHLGRSGSDGGIDIEGTEIDSQTELKNWIVQCKRYKSFSPKEAESVIESLKTKYPSNNNFLLIISCPFSKTGHNRLNELKAKLEIEELQVWTNSNLEAELYHNHPDLLNIYFGISIGTSFDLRLELIEKRKKFRNDLGKELLVEFDSSKPIIGPHRFHHRKFIVRSVMDDVHETYQDNFGWYSYFGVQPYDIGDFGISVNLEFDYGYINEKQEFVRSRNSEEKDRRTIIKRAHLPYENILTYDLDNGECRPMFYCIYKGEKGPFDKIEWEIE